MTLRDWNDSLLIIFAEGGGTASYVTFQWILFGPAQQRAPFLIDFKKAWMNDLVKGLETKP